MSWGTPPNPRAQSGGIWVGEKVGVLLLAEWRGRGGLLAAESHLS